MDVKCELYHDSFENARTYQIPRADCIIADIPYNLGKNFYASRPDWWQENRVENGESNLANKAAFHTDFDFNIPNFFAFCARLLRKEPGKNEVGAPCMICFCSWEQIPIVTAEAQKHGFKHATPLIFIKRNAAGVLKANQKVLTACEYAILLYRDKLPKFRNDRGLDGKKHMILNWFEWERDSRDIPRIHPTQKPIKVLKQLITIFTDPGDVVIDPCAGSGTTLRAARELGRHSYGFECSREFYEKATTQMLEL